MVCVQAIFGVNAPLVIEEESHVEIERVVVSEPDFAISNISASQRRKEEKTEACDPCI
jgi:hypothetical protein